MEKENKLCLSENDYSVYKIINNRDRVELVRQISKRMYHTKDIAIIGRYREELYSIFYLGTLGKELYGIFYKEEVVGVFCLQRGQYDIHCPGIADEVSVFVLDNNYNAKTAYKAIKKIVREGNATYICLSKRIGPFEYKRKYYKIRRPNNGWWNFRRQ